MAQARIVRGSEKEIAAILHQLKGRKDLTLIVPAEDIGAVLSPSNAARGHFLFDSNAGRSPEGLRCVGGRQAASTYPAARSV